MESKFIDWAKKAWVHLTTHWTAARAALIDKIGTFPVATTGGSYTNIADALADINSDVHNTFAQVNGKLPVPFRFVRAGSASVWLEGRQAASQANAGAGTSSGPIIRAAQFNTGPFRGQARVYFEYYHDITAGYEANRGGFINVGKAKNPESRLAYGATQIANQDLNSSTGVSLSNSTPLRAWNGAFTPWFDIEPGEVIGVNVQATKSHDAASCSLHIKNIGLCFTADHTGGIDYGV